MRRLYVSTVSATLIRACDSRAAGHDRYAGRQWWRWQFGSGTYFAPETLGSL